ncbi:tail fiber protein [soil metagenome]
MSTQFIGEIKMFGGNFAILGYAFCDGSLLPISQYDALFSLLGTTYGGDGQQTFGLPDLRGRIPVHQGAGPGLSPRTLGENSGSETVTLNTNQLASHNHTVIANTNTGTSGNPQGNIVAGTSLTPYNTTAVNNQMGGRIDNTGGSQPHDNIMPIQCVNYIIALEGIYPPRN